MRILLIHSDYLNYNVKKKTPVAEEIEEAKHNGSFDDSLVVFTAVEKEDEDNPQGIVKNLVKEVLKTNDQVKAENIVSSVKLTVICEEHIILLPSNGIPVKVGFIFYSIVFKFGGFDKDGIREHLNILFK